MVVCRITYDKLGYFSERKRKIRSSQHVQHHSGTTGKDFCFLLAFFLLLGFRLTAWCISAKLWGAKHKLEADFRREKEQLTRLICARDRFPVFEIVVLSVYHYLNRQSFELIESAWISFDWVYWGESQEQQHFEMSDQNPTLTLQPYTNITLNNVSRDSFEQRYTIKEITSSSRICGIMSGRKFTYYMLFGLNCFHHPQSFWKASAQRKFLVNHKFRSIINCDCGCSKTPPQQHPSVICSILASRATFPLQPHWQTAASYPPLQQSSHPVHFIDIDSGFSIATGNLFQP